MERIYGVPLLERGSNILLTQDVERLVVEARDIWSQLENFPACVQQAQGSFKIDLRFGVIATITPFYCYEY